MVKTRFRESRAAALFASSGLAAAWYVAAQNVLTGPAAEVIPVFGVIAIAGILPLILQDRVAKRQEQNGQFSISQRLDALDKHACINIVNLREEIVEVNEKLLELTGYDRADLVNQPVTNMYANHTPELVAEAGSALLRGESWEGETALRCKDGQIVYTQSTIMPLFNAAGELAGSIALCRDVSKTSTLMPERHTAQALYELHNDVWVIDAETEKFTYLNRAAEDRFDLTNGGHLGLGLSELCQSDDTAKILEACRALKASGAATKRFETALMESPVEVSIKILQDAESADRYLILISDAPAQENQKSEFIATVSHELRSPLTSIKGAMGLLLSRSAGELPDKARSLLEIAHRNADRLILIINDILDLDKIANGEMDLDLQEVDLAALVREADQATAMLQQRFGVKVELHGIENPVPFHTDPNRFIQVMTNLLSNAYKFSAPNSTISIDIEDAGAQMRVSVTDEGQGIPAGEHHKIFNRFSDMANSDRALKGGTGLGLNICKAIVEMMGGTIGFDTQEGVGTTFYFHLPKATLGGMMQPNTTPKRSAG